MVLLHNHDYIFGFLPKNFRKPQMDMNFFAIFLIIGQGRKCRCAKNVKNAKIPEPECTVQADTSVEKCTP